MKQKRCIDGPTDTSYVRAEDNNCKPKGVGIKIRMKIRGFTLPKARHNRDGSQDGGGKPAGGARKSKAEGRYGGREYNGKGVLVRGVTFYI